MKHDVSYLITERILARRLSNNHPATKKYVQEYLFKCSYNKELFMEEAYKQCELRGWDWMGENMPWVFHIVLE